MELTRESPSDADAKDRYIDQLYYDVSFYRDKALDLVCEKLVLDDICPGTCDSPYSFCSMAYEIVDSPDS